MSLCLFLHHVFLRILEFSDNGQASKVLSRTRGNVSSTYETCGSAKDNEDAEADRPPRAPVSISRSSVDLLRGNVNESRTMCRLLRALLGCPLGGVELKDHAWKRKKQHLNFLSLQNLYTIFSIFRNISSTIQPCPLERLASPVCLIKCYELYC